MQKDVDKITSAIEDLLLMNIIEFRSEVKGENIEEKKEEGESKNPIYSISFSNIFSNLVSERKPSTKDDYLRILYYSFFIYLYEYKNLPKDFVMNLATDLENSEENTTCKELVFNYVLILYDIYENKMKEFH